MYWVGRSTIPDRSLSLSKVLFIFTQANTTTDASSTETRWSKGTKHPLGTILCTFSCPLDKLAGYLRNLLGKMDPAKHRYPQLSNLSLRLPQLLENVVYVCCSQDCNNFLFLIDVSLLMCECLRRA